MLTGVGPGRHGLWDFTQREGYRVRFASGERREAPNLLEMLSRLGRRVVGIGFPGTFPPVEVRGAILAGWDSPAAVRGEPSGCRPAALHEVLARRFGEDYLPFDVLDQFRAGSSAGPAWYREAAGRLVESVGRRIELAMFLAGEWGESPDLLAVHFPETDTAGHHMWNLHDLGSPRRPTWIEAFTDERTGRVADPLADVYGAVDDAVGELVDRFHPDAVVVVSDHGMGGSGIRIASLNRLLAREGMLRLKEGAGGQIPDLLGEASRMGLPLVPAGVRAGLLAGLGSGLAGQVASRIRFGGIDWSRTVAFSEDLNYATSVFLNESGREPSGIVHAGERTWWLQLVVDALEGWRAPAAPGVVETEPLPVVKKVHVREELFRGPLLERLPDLVVELAGDGPYSFNLHPGYFRSMVQPVEPLPEALLQGSKGRSMPGSHRPEGMFLLAFPSGSEDARPGDLGAPSQTSIAPLVMELQGFRVPGYFDSEPGRTTTGRLEWVDPEVLQEWYREARKKAKEQGQDQGQDQGLSTSPEGEAAVEKRLEDLGYI